MVHMVYNASTDGMHMYVMVGDNKFNNLPKDLHEEQHKFINDVVKD